MGNGGQGIQRLLTGAAALVLMAGAAMGACRDDKVDLRAPLRNDVTDGLLHQAIDQGIAAKPKGHDFIIDRTTKQPAVSRHMSVTGG